MANVIPSPTASESTDVEPATIESIYISPGHSYWTRRGEPKLQHAAVPVDQVECVAGRGIVGDRYFDKRPGHKGQLTLIDADVLRRLRERFPGDHWDAGTLRRNVVVRGLDLASLLHREFTIQGVTLYGSQECKPCRWMDQQIGDGAKDLMSEPFTGGLRTRIVTGGTLTLGATL